MYKLALALGGSIVVLMQAIQQHGNDVDFMWAVVVSITSIILCSVALLLNLMQKAEFMKPLMLILVTTWIIGTSVMTMKGPFTHTGNGYFGAWLALGMSWLLAMDFLPLLRGQLGALCTRGNEAIGALTLASLTIFVQTLWNLTDGHCSRLGYGACRNEVLWILTCSGVSLLLCSLLYFPNISSKIQPNFRYLALFLMFWWAAGFFIATFDAPYVHAGNGFFACWVALIASLVLFDMTWGVNGSAARQIPSELAWLSLGSVVVLVAATYEKHTYDAWTWWAVICSSVSVVIAAVLIAIMGSDRASSIARYLPSLSFFLAVWWAFGTGFMTFKKPFVLTTNGYFGTWLALGSALLFCQAHSSSLMALIGQAGEHGPGLAILVLASATLFLKALVDALSICNRCGVSGNIIWALVGSGVSLLICMLVANFFTRLNDGFKWIVLGLTILWGVLVNVLTFDAPYTNTSNAYFACWVGLCAAVFMLLRSFPAVTQRAAVMRAEVRSAPATQVQKQSIQVNVPPVIISVIGRSDNVV